MKIALMTNNYKPFIGGVPVSIERLKRGLEAQGHRVTVFAPTYEEQNGKAEEENVFRYATLMKHFIGGIVLPNPFDRRIEQEFRRQNFDVIHVHHPMLIGRTAVYLSRKYHIPLVFTYHTRYEQYAGCYTKSRLIEKLTPLYLQSFLRHCSFIFAPTESIRQYLTQICGVPAERVGILPTGLEESCFHVSAEAKAALRKRFGAENIPLFITVSRMAQEKNVTFLLKSLALFKQRSGKPFRMLMIGEGPDRAAYEALSASLGLQQEVCFTGQLPNDEIAPYYAAADLFLFASATETQGIVILEAFAGGTPVAAVDAPGVRDLVENGRNGILTAQDPYVFAQKLEELAGDTQLQSRMAENAVGTALLYREEAVALKAVYYYNKVTEAKVFVLSQA